MPQYRVTGPDGHSYDVTAPEGATQDQVMAYVQSQHGSAQPGKPYNPATDPATAGRYQQALQQNVQDLGTVGRLAAGFGKAFVDTGRGIGQLVGAADPQDVANARQIDAPLQESGAGAVGNFAGQAAQMVALGGAGGAALKGASALGRAAPYVASALSSGAFTGAQPVADGESRAANAAIGAGLGVVGEAAPAVLGVAARKAAPVVSQAKQDAIATAQKYGIPLHISQVSDSKALKTVASAAKYLPFSGSAAAAKSQQGAFNKAILNQVGENADSITDPVLSSAAKRISDGYNSLFGRNTVKLDANDVSKLANITNNATRLAGKDAGTVIGNHVDDIVKNLDQSSSMPGELYQALRTDQLLPAEQSANPATAMYLKKVRQVLQDAATRSMGPQDAAELATLNNQYKNLKIIQKAVSKRAAGAGGDIAPANLWSLVNGKYGSTKEMRDLAKLGQTVLKDPIPDSGTPARLLAYGAMGGGGGAAAYLGGLSILPHIAVPIAAGATFGRALNSPLAARVLPGSTQSILQRLSSASRPANRILPLLSTTPPVGVGSQGR